MGDCEEADLVYMCNTLKAMEEKHRDLSSLEKITQKQKICSHTKLSHSLREREREFKKQTLKVKKKCEKILKKRISGINSKLKNYISRDKQKNNYIWLGSN